MKTTRMLNCLSINKSKSNKKKRTRESCCLIWFEWGMLVCEMLNTTISH